MKTAKLITAILIISLLLSGCGYQVPKPMTYPDYTFSEAPNTDELRMTAVRATRDLLSVQWHTKQTISYNKTGPVSGKHFQHNPKTTYAGVLYTNANTGLFQFLEYYDYNTGELCFNGTSDELKTTIGTSCADAILWGWSTVCNSISAGFYPTFMICANGYLPVGNYTYNFNVNTYNLMPTYAILEDNDDFVIYDAYSKVLPADALVSSSDNHAMMVIEKPTVIYLEDGTIDTENSYIMIQDQRGGRGTGFYEVIENGNKLNYSGCISVKFTFDELYKKHFVPVTAAEFIGTKEYEKATITISDSNVSTLYALTNATIKSNYPLAIINIYSINNKGQQTLIEKILFNGTAITGVPREYALNQSKELVQYENADWNISGNRICVEVVPSTGERFVAIEFEI